MSTRVLCQWRSRSGWCNLERNLRLCAGAGQHLGCSVRRPGGRRGDGSAFCCWPTAEPGKLPHLSEPQCPPHLSPDVHHMPGHFFCRLYVDPFISSLHTLTHAHVHIHVCTCIHSASQSHAQVCTNTPPWTQVCSSSAIWIIPSWSSTSGLPGPSHLTPIACLSEPQWQSHTRLPSISLSCLGCV